MTAGAPSLGRFVLRTFLWLPPSFAAWYFIAPAHAAITGMLARVWVDLFKSGLVSAIERQGSEVAFVTTLQVHPAPGQTALLVPDVNSLLYTYGLAFFLALMVAARGKWWKILAGAAALLPFQGWGIAFDFLAQVAARLGSDIAVQAGLTGWRGEAIALGYQVGSLIFPTLVPIVLWALFCRAFIESALRPGDSQVHPL